MKYVKSMVYDILDEAKRGEDQVENCVPLTADRISYLYSVTDFHDTAAIWGRLYADSR